MIKIYKTSSPILPLLALLMASVLMPTYANGQSKLETYLRDADLDSDGRIEPHEMTGPIKRYMTGKGYDISERHRIRDVIRAAEEKPAAQPKASELKVPKFGVEASAGSGVSSFANAADTVQYSESVTQKAREIIEKYDRNGNGILDEGEIARMSWGSPRPSANDTNGDGRLSFAEVQGRYHEREIASQRNAKSAGNNKPQSSQDQERRYRNERGGDDRRGRSRYGRGEENNQDSNSSRGSTPNDSGSGRGEPSSHPSTAPKSKLDRTKEYVEKYFDDRDKDSNGILEGAELAKVRSTARYDTNNDGKIEQDEMLDVMSPPETRTKKTSVRGSSSDRRSTIRTTRSSSKTSGAFKKVDEDNDSLVQMHEFSKKWTQKDLDNFLKKDKNGDGVIDPSEW